MLKIFVICYGAWTTPAVVFIDIVGLTPTGLSEEWCFGLPYYSDWIVLWVSYTRFVASFWAESVIEIIALLFFPAWLFIWFVIICCRDTLYYYYCKDFICGLWAELCTKLVAIFPFFKALIVRFCEEAEMKK